MTTTQRYCQAIEVRYLPAHDNNGPRLRLTSLMHASNRRVIPATTQPALIPALTWLANAGAPATAFADAPRGRWIVFCENLERLP